MKWRCEHAATRTKPKAGPVISSSSRLFIIELERACFHFSVESQLVTAGAVWSPVWLVVAVVVEFAM